MTVYFNLAYGSNMSSNRLLARLPNAKRIGVAMVEGYKLAYHKKGFDDSGKCDAYYTGDKNDILLGVLYQITAEEKAILDQIEGPRYSICNLTVKHESGEHFDAYCYVANTLDHSLLPYDWYLQHVIAGAKEAQLPEHYVTKICQQVTQVDPDSERSQREFLIHKK
ncbi:gamma-glutamylcyclotransferase family protein [Pseudoalteromonas tunicata]|uniref:gamma-glutamylcyclotransferase family protein n=1 Tax=Pseudoalteromonas tunicata TaxID=314281 RepID=UPI00273D22A2|nr:gamma-glutamylcyclotransferase family protein [Pseudoalteromonas tunicata]MDP4984130.1 gamma-glutamylcyclotransferase [Pseudoalteromonas tunicata]MDP5211767.1 gamma-glutamylcyclotransferase [Pseudoalteromonas tunicata]